MTVMQEEEAASEEVPRTPDECVVAERSPTVGALDVGVAVDSPPTGEPVESEGNRPVGVYPSELPIDDSYIADTDANVSTPTHRSKASSRSSHRSSPTPTARSRLPTHRPSPESSSPFTPWQSNEPYKTGLFAILLLDEFCRHYRLDATLEALYTDLEQHELAVDSTALWCELLAQCRSLLSATTHSHPLAKTGSTLERLVDFCVHPPAQKAAFARSVAVAHSPMQVAVAPSPTKRPSVGSPYSLMSAFSQLQSPITRPSKRPSGTATASVSSPVRHGSDASVYSTEARPRAHQRHDQHQLSDTNSPRLNPLASMSKKKKKKKTRTNRSNGVVSVGSHYSGSSSPHHPLNTSSSTSTSKAGTFGEPVLVEAYRVDLQRDLIASRRLERELRNVRIEAIVNASPGKLSIQKKLGFHTLTPHETAARQPQEDPYASELVLEKYGFAKRQDCALCQFAFLPFNLPHKVSFKCLLDVYDAWGYVPPDRDTLAKYRPPLCYDPVLVCRMCAQIVFQHTKQPATQQAIHPLSRKHRKAKSMASLHPSVGDADNTSCCSDPYSLPPLLGEDVYDHCDQHFNYHGGNHANARRGRPGLDVLDGDLRSGVSESAAKAIYAHHISTVQLLSVKEWEVINPDKSATRHSLESSVLALQAAPGQHRE